MCEACLTKAELLQSVAAPIHPCLMRFNKLPLLLALGLASGTLQAQVFRCLDAAGKTAYQEQPCSNAQASKNQTVLRIPSQAAEPGLAAPGTSRPAEGKGQPERGAFTLFYDPANAPARYPAAAVEEIIAYAAQVWAERCLVDIKYGGQAVYWPVGTRQRVSIRWQPGYADRAHPSAFNSMTTGTGSLATGIELSPTIRELRALFVHELGHVLGIGHLHGDSEAIMGYLRHTGGTLSARPAPIDYLACNLAMKRSFGVAFEASPEDVARVETALRVSDRQAVEKREAARR
ncbi:MAG: DUF4124 domain-containing protein [Burkholderiales bacterium]|nr:MAG: DUF4124 domain-containing protein [Burkholderiales bacterium]